ncbi:cell division protein DivIVA [Micromonospora echinospora]|uniref:DivIVA domain-containing protein n=1 Tax=Micromonospora echinospora TaxID=1877 RepID=A0A1C4VQ18_MICEC|nr:DivIVA domain-containing protein [Micromonospora echinospora]OZV75544.1 cell division protein DivIVA [Micromonospora echinospora]SCE86077.1 DivIVA domain-containing protein [Micromonospora echinospora]
MIYLTGKRLGPHQIRSVEFDRCWRGLAPDQVRSHLDRVAGEVERLHRHIRAVEADGDRIRQALRCWQSEYAQRRPADSGPRHGRW